MSHGDGGIIAQHKYGGFLATIQAFGERHEIPYIGFGVTEIKKHWTGKGNAKKESIVDMARLLGFNPKDDNEADALAILHLGHHTFDVIS